MLLEAVSIFPILAKMARFSALRAHILYACCALVLKNPAIWAQVGEISTDPGNHTYLSWMAIVQSFLFFGYY